MSRHLNRRTMLKGVGCAMGLPLLEAMLPHGRGAASLADAAHTIFAEIARRTDHRQAPMLIASSFKHSKSASYNRNRAVQVRSKSSAVTSSLICSS